MKEDRVKKILDILYEMHPDARCELNHTSTYELLVATVLSAQTTDVKVNIVTKNLFEKANTPEAMLTLSLNEIINYINIIGLSKSKAKYLLSLSKDIVEKFNGDVPKEMESLISLSGVGRKTANVVMSVGFNVPAMAVDTHVRRLANRIGFSSTENVLIIEKDLKRQIPREKWILTHHMLIFHGRRICKAQSPSCGICKLNTLCEYYK